MIDVFDPQSPQGYRVSNLIVRRIRKVFYQARLDSRTLDLSLHISLFAEHATIRAIESMINDRFSINGSVIVQFGLPLSEFPLLSSDFNTFPLFYLDSICLVDLYLDGICYVWIFFRDYRLRVINYGSKFICFQLLSDSDPLLPFLNTFPLTDSDKIWNEVNFGMLFVAFVFFLLEITSPFPEFRSPPP